MPLVPVDSPLVTLHVEVWCPRRTRWACLSVCFVSHFSPTAGSLRNPFQSGFCPRQSSHDACVVLPFANPVDDSPRPSSLKTVAAEAAFDHCYSLWTLFSSHLGQLLLSLWLASSCFSQSLILEGLRAPSPFPILFLSHLFQPPTLSYHNTLVNPKRLSPARTPPLNF